MLLTTTIIFSLSMAARADGGCANIVSKVYGVTAIGSEVGDKEPLAVNTALLLAINDAVEKALEGLKGKRCEANCHPEGKPITSADYDDPDNPGSEYKPVVIDSGKIAGKPNSKWLMACISHEIALFGRSFDDALARCIDPDFSSKYPNYAVVEAKANGTATIICKPNLEGTYYSENSVYPYYE